MHRALRVAKLADVAGALTLEALLGTPAAFDARLHAARPHAGQIAVAAHLRWLMDASEIRESHRHGDPRVQDAYSLRCMPQVHGAVRDALAYAQTALEIETGSATDNPLVFPDEGLFISGGNFHGEAVALAADVLKIVVVKCSLLMERQLNLLLNDAIKHTPRWWGPPGRGRQSRRPALCLSQHFVRLPFPRQAAGSRG